MVMSLHENVGRNHNVKMANSYFEISVEHFIYLGTTVTNENCIEE